MTTRDTNVDAYGMLGVFLVLSIGLGYILITHFTILFEYFKEMKGSDITNSLGTIYALITAFILVNVWNHHNDTNEAIAKENEAIIALWSNTDFLEDTSTTKGMKQALQHYLNKIRKEEIEIHKSRDSVKFTSKELTEILKVVDRIKFDDPRDNIAFEALVRSYELLLSSRNSRISNIDNRIPGIMKFFYVFVSFIFWFGYLIRGYDSIGLYLLILGIVSLFTALSYVIIGDLDKPLAGLLQVSLSRYADSAIFIEEAGHDVFSVPNKEFIEEWKRLTA